MIEYVLHFMKELDFDSEAIGSLYSDIQKIYANAESKGLFEAAIGQYEQDLRASHASMMEKVDHVAAIADVHPYSAALLLYLCLSKRLREAYIENGIELQIFRNSMLDLKWKLLECKAVKHVWGTFVASWFKGFFELTRFALGRLQFELIPLDRPYSKAGKVVPKGAKVINVHIPRTLTPLDPKSCDESYELAKEFFKEQIGDVPVAFVCYSWLLFPPYTERLKENSNVRRFALQYDVIGVAYDHEGEYPDAWRLFDMDYTGDAEDYPADTSLRQAIKQYMIEGGRTGSGIGIFLG